MGQNERWNRHIQELYILSGDIGTQDGFFTRVVPYATSVDTGGEFTPGYFHRRRLVSLYRNQLYFSELSKPVCRGSSRSFLNSPPVSMLACPNHSWTLAMSALCARALVAAVARTACTQKPCTSVLMPTMAP